MYLEPDKSKGKYSLVAYPMAGLGLFVDTGATTTRALLEHNEVLYAVQDNKFRTIASNGTVTDLGTLNTSTGWVKMAVITGGQDSNNQIMIIDGTNGYTYNLGSSVGQFPITDVDFPQTCQDLATSDDYVIVENNGSISFNISTVADSTSWNALDFASKIGKADRLTAIYSNQRRLWLFGSKTTEIWYNSGNVNFPFERIPDTFIHIGCAAKASIAMLNEQLIFLGKTVNGGYNIYMMNGYIPSPIANPAIAHQINTFTTVSDAEASAFFLDGHLFYQITFPTAAKTFAYDVTTGVWLERQSYTGSVYSSFKGTRASFCYGKSLVGDTTSGKIYYQSTSVYTENSTQLRKQFQSAPIYYNGARIFIDRLQIDLETGVGSSKQFTVEKSTDSGRTWSTLGTYNIPDANGRIYINKIGSARSFVFRITSTADANFIILGFQAMAGAGDF